MPAKLETTIAKISKIPNIKNSTLIKEYYEYMKQNGSSERHMNNQVKAAIAYCILLGPKRALWRVRNSKQILEFLDSKIKDQQTDPDKKWITTWNDYLHRIKRLFRWLYNQQGKRRNIPEEEWKTPSFALIRERKTKRLRPRIRRLLDTGEITDPKEREILEILLKTKRWNPYCLRHSAICYDSDHLPGYAVNKKVRWSMNSKQAPRYIQNRLSKDLTQQILARDGIIVEEAARQKPAFLECKSCRYINRPDLKNCSKCSWPLDQTIVQKIQGDGKDEISNLREQLKTLQEDNDKRFNQVLTLIRQRPELANIKPEVLNRSTIENRNIMAANHVASG